MKTRLYLALSGLVFIAVCVVQLARVYNRWPIELNGHLLPLAASWCIATVSLLLALWGFSAAGSHRHLR